MFLTNSVVHLKFIWSVKKLKKLFKLYDFYFLDLKKNSFLEKLVLFLDPREHYFMLCYIDVT